MLLRYFRDARIHPFIGCCLVLLVFTGSSLYVLKKGDAACWFYFLAALAAVVRLSGEKRNDFLKICFAGKDYIKIRMLENVLVSLPFTGMLALEERFPAALALPVLSAVVSLLNIKIANHFVIPVPSGNLPFEFSSGFRKNAFIIPGIYALAGISIAAGNFNLGMFSLLVLQLLCIAFYSKTEPAYYVWVYALNPSRFIFLKIKDALKSVFLLSLPVFAGLGIFFFENILLVFLVPVAGFAYVILVLLAKYASFPGQVGLLYAVLIGFSFSFPPVLLVLLPFFYARAVSKLSTVLK